MPAGSPTLIAIRGRGMQGSLTSVPSPWSPALSSPQSTVQGPQSLVHGPQSSVLGPRSSVLGPQSLVLSPWSTVLSPWSSVLSPVLSPWSSVHGPGLSHQKLQRQLRHLLELPATFDDEFIGTPPVS